MGVTDLHPLRGHKPHEHARSDHHTQLAKNSFDESLHLTAEVSFQYLTHYIKNQGTAINSTAFPSRYPYRFIHTSTRPRPTVDNVYVQLLHFAVWRYARAVPKKHPTRQTCAQEPCHTDPAGQHDLDRAWHGDLSGLFNVFLLGLHA